MSNLIEQIATIAAAGAGGLALIYGCRNARKYSKTKREAAQKLREIVADLSENGALYFLEVNPPDYVKTASKYAFARENMHRNIVIAAIGGLVAIGGAASIVKDCFVNNNPTSAPPNISSEQSDRRPASSATEVRSGSR